MNIGDDIWRTIFCRHRRLRQQERRPRAKGSTDASSLCSSRMGMGTSGLAEEDRGRVSLTPVGRAVKPCATARVVVRHTAPRNERAMGW